MPLPQDTSDASVEALFRSGAISRNDAWVYLHEGDEYKAVSSVLDGHLGSFAANRSAVVGGMRKRHGVSISAACDYLDACRDFGTESHLAIEECLGGTGPEVPFFLPFLDTCLRGRFWLVASELRVLDARRHLAGTIDLLLTQGHRDSAGRLRVVLIDWKFSKQHTPSKRYKLQLNLYRHLAESSGFAVDAMYLVFMHPQLPLDFYLKEVAVDNSCAEWQ